MPRRPEIGNIQLYPQRPLKPSDRNGFVLKFYCPIRKTRVRKNCGTRNRREARKILRECSKRLLNGEYLKSGGEISVSVAVSATIAKALIPTQFVDIPANLETTIKPTSKDGKSWEYCYEQYRKHKKKRSSKKDSFNHARSRLKIAEKIFQDHMKEIGQSTELLVKNVMTLEMLEYLQEQLLDGAQSKKKSRSPNTVNSMMGAVMSFVRFCCKREWIDKAPDIEALGVDGVMKGRPITEEEFLQMLKVVDEEFEGEVAKSWKFALHVLWYSGFRVGDLMDFHWTDDRHICPIWPNQDGQFPTISVPSTQKNNKVQIIPLLPELETFLNAVPQGERNGWIVNPIPVSLPANENVTDRFRPLKSDLIRLAKRYSNLSIADVCGVTETTVRKWLKQASFRRKREFKVSTGAVPSNEVLKIKNNFETKKRRTRKKAVARMTIDYVSRTISMIGEKAGIVVKRKGDLNGSPAKFASAHDIRRGCAQRLINEGLSAETLKVVMRHADFATTEKFYGATRSAQAAAKEVHSKLNAECNNSELVGGLMGGNKKTPQLEAEELKKLKLLLSTL